MALSRLSKMVLYLVGFGGLAAVLGLFLAFGPPQLFAKTSTPEFCGSCHVLEPQYEAWFHAGAHRRIACVDCHLPNDTFPRHLLWKTVDGVHDVIRFNTGQVSEAIKLSDRGAGVVQENCLRCHATTMFRVNEDRNCWSCHRRLSHRLSGAMETRSP
ncbi:MAG: cytochrome c nitrite reductase small subunit [Deltaproteobacteria bacterium]|nr:cytochrome c nitrite reductase small subunit [Deltaproteobacteria bacterium]